MAETGLEQLLDNQRSMRQSTQCLYLVLVWKEWFVLMEMSWTGG